MHDMNHEERNQNVSSTHSPVTSSTHQPVTLITGGAGFLGSHLCDRLIEEGHHVICMDNLLTGSEENIKHLLDHDHFTFIDYDVTQHINLDALLSDPHNSLLITHHLDNILHFASPASPKDYLEYPIHTLKVGALGTHNTLGLAKATGATYLLASSSEVYGDPQINPQPETYWGHVNPVGPRSVYDEAKRYAEAITVAYHKAHDVDIRIARIFNTYGPRMKIDDGRALPNFMMQALQNEPLTVYGDGSQTRSFCYVDDLTEGLCRLLLSNETDPVNLGNPDELTILAFAHKVLEATGGKSEIVHRSLPEDDPRVRRPDITRAAAILEWEPEVTLDEGLKSVREFFQELLAERLQRTPRST